MLDIQEQMRVGMTRGWLDASRLKSLRKSLPLSDPWSAPVLLCPICPVCTLQPAMLLKTFHATLATHRSCMGVSTSWWLGIQARSRKKLKVCKQDQWVHIWVVVAYTPREDISEVIRSSKYGRSSAKPFLLHVNCSIHWHDLARILYLLLKVCHMAWITNGDDYVA